MFRTAILPCFLGLIVASIGSAEKLTCGKDLLVGLYTNPKVAQSQAEELLRRFKRGKPRSAEQYELLHEAILTMPDCPLGSSAEQNLLALYRMAWEWQIENVRTNSPHLRDSLALWQAIGMRLILLGKAADRGDATFAALLLSAKSFLTYHSHLLPAKDTMEMWRHRIVNAIVEEGDRIPMKFLLFIPTELWRVDTITAPDLVKRPRQGHLNKLAGLEALTRNAYADILKAWVLNPHSPSHSFGIKCLLEIGGIAASRIESGAYDSLNRSLVEALRGYLDERIFLRSARDPAVEATIRQLLPRLNIPFPTDRVDEFEPGPFLWSP